MKHRVQVTREDREGGARGCERCIAQVRAQAMGEPHGQPTLEPVARERQRGRGLVAGAQHVGRAWVPRPVAVRVREAEQFADHDRERHRSEQVRSRDDAEGGERSIHLQCAHDARSNDQV